MQAIDIIDTITKVIGIIFAVCYAYQIVYLIVPYLLRSKPHKKTVPHRYAILIAARNEIAVLPHLLDSIKQQDYPSELVTVFVVADNCTDETAEVARAHGAVVYERFNQNLVGKGYALDYLLSNIAADYGKDAFDAFMVFDADNLLAPNYITEMNKTFSDGHEIITSYRNSKNYGDNWISAGYGLWFLREAKYLNNSRMLLNTSCAVSGTGFCFSRRILEEAGGWKFFLLTEDIQFSIWNVVQGRRIAYCPNARFYDEQPTSFRQSFRQRMRWAKGNIQVFIKYIGKLVAGIFHRPGAFACYDMTMTILPAMGMGILGVLWIAFTLIVGFIYGRPITTLLLSLMEILAKGYLGMFLLGLITTISEWKMLQTSAARKILYAFTFPLFMATWIPIGIIALFRRVEWKPIVHTKAVAIHSMQTE